MLTFSLEQIFGLFLSYIVKSPESDFRALSHWTLPYWFGFRGISLLPASYLNAYRFGLRGLNDFLYPPGCPLGLVSDDHTIITVIRGKQRFLGLGLKHKDIPIVFPLEHQLLFTQFARFRFHLFINRFHHRSPDEYQGVSDLDHR